MKANQAIQQLRENLLVQFSLVSLVAMAIIAVALSILLAQSARNSVLEKAAEEAQHTLSLRVASRLSPEDFQQPMKGERYARFDQFVTESVASARTARVKLWNREGVLIYSTDPVQVGERFPIKAELQAALSGGVGWELSVPQAAENIRERELGTLIEVYVPLYLGGSATPDGSLEVYQHYAPYAGHIRDQQRLIFLIVPGGFLLLYLSLVGLVARGWRTITRQRRRLEQDTRELRGLNRLLQGHLSQRLHVLDEIQDLSQEMAKKEICQRECGEHLSRLRRLAKDAAAPPTSPIEHTEPGPGSG